VAPILELAAQAGVSSVTGIALHLRGEVRDVFFEWLSAHRPDLMPRYEELYRGRAYAPAAERRRLARLVAGPKTPNERVRERSDRRFEGRSATGHVGAAAPRNPDHDSEPERTSERNPRSPQQRLF
jgi:DNA repair photolyase